MGPTTYHSAYLIANYVWFYAARVSATMTSTVGTCVHAHCQHSFCDTDITCVKLEQIMAGYGTSMALVSMPMGPQCNWDIY